MASFNRAQTSAAYVVVLNKKDPSPLLPESDDEQEGAADKPAEKSADQDKEKKDEKERKEPPKVQVDLENIDQRILALPIPNRNYVGIIAGKANTLYILEAEAVNIPRRGPPPGKVLHKFDLSKRKFEKLLDDVNELAVSNNGAKDSLSHRAQELVLDRDRRSRPSPARDRPSPAKERRSPAKNRSSSTRSR